MGEVGAVGVGEALAGPVEEPGAELGVRALVAGDAAEDAAVPFRPGLGTGARRPFAAPPIVGYRKSVASSPNVAWSSQRPSHHSAWRAMPSKRKPRRAMTESDGVVVGGGGDADAVRAHVLEGEVERGAGGLGHEPAVRSPPCAASSRARTSGAGGRRPRGRRRRPACGGRARAGRSGGPGPGPSRRRRPRRSGCWRPDRCGTAPTGASAGGRRASRSPPARARARRPGRWARRRRSVSIGRRAQLRRGAGSPACHLHCTRAAYASRWPAS